MAFDQRVVIREYPNDTNHITGFYGPIWFDNELLRQCLEHILKIPALKELGVEPTPLERLALQVIEHLGQI